MCSGDVLNSQLLWGADFFQMPLLRLSLFGWRWSGFKAAMDVFRKYIFIRVEKQFEKNGLRAWFESMV
jgi:hypothetical protein